MCLLPTDQYHLDHALALAENAAAFASPNPAVGCVLARGTNLLGAGAHFYEDRDHAEVAALKAATAAHQDVTGATAYVTLEPCSHHGRTGPCADALIAAGIRRCVVATVDPNPLVRGGGLAKLQAAGIDTELLSTSSSQAKRARRLNDAFAFSVQHGRPFVTLKSAVSRDGMLAPPDAHRTGSAPFWLTGTAAREDVQLLRHDSDAILTGIGTVLADDPSLNDRTGRPRRRPLMRVVLDSNLRMPLVSKLVQSAKGDLLLIAAQEASREREQGLRAQGVEIARVPTREGGLDLDALMAKLAAAQVRSLLIEGGSALNAALLRQGLVDKLVLYTAPVNLGADAIPFAHNLKLAEVTNSLTSAEEHSFPNGNAEDVRLSGYLHDPWAEVGA